MTKKEAAQILAILKAAYPNSYKMTAEEANGTIAVWCMQFATTPPDIVLMAVNKLISSSKFPPSIHEVKNKIGALYWEAYSALSDSMNELTEQERKQYQRIYDETREYKFEKCLEPPLRDMLGHGAQFLIGGGE